MTMEIHLDSTRGYSTALLKFWFAFANKLFKPFSDYAMYCIEGIEMKQLGCKVRRLLFFNRY